MKISLKTVVAAVMLLFVPFAADAQDKKAERRARKEARKIEVAIRDSLRRFVADEE